MSYGYCVVESGGRWSFMKEIERHSTALEQGPDGPPCLYKAIMGHGFPYSLTYCQ